MTYLVLIAFFAILASLGAALYFMLKGGGNNADGQPRTKGMARALAFRVGFSILLFLCILLAWRLGYIHPTGIPPGK